MKKLVFTIFVLISSLNGSFLDAIKEYIPQEKKETKAQSDNELLSSIQSATNLTDTQSIGTVGTLLNYAKNNMKSDEYSSITKKVPSLDSFTSASGLTSMVSNSLSSSEMVNSSFKTLGVDPSMVKIIVPIVVNYVGKYAGEASKSIFSNSLSGLVK